MSRAALLINRCSLNGRLECFPYHRAGNLKDEEYGLACANDLEKFLRGPNGISSAAFILEPVVGATLGAAVPSAGYVERIAEICGENRILLIADEIMSGMGRTAKGFRHSTLERGTRHDSGGERESLVVTRRSALLWFLRASSKHSNAVLEFSSTVLRIRRTRSALRPAMRCLTTWKLTNCSNEWRQFQKLDPPIWSLCGHIRMSVIFAAWAY